MTTGFYAADGGMRVSVVSGSSYTGLYAADGSINVVNRTGVTTPVGAYHPCGALNVVVPSSPTFIRRAANGSLNVTISPYTNGGVHVTVVSGSLSGGTSPTYYIYGF